MLDYLICINAVQFDLNWIERKQNGIPCMDVSRWRWSGLPKLAPTQGTSVLCLDLHDSSSTPAGLLSAYSLASSDPDTAAADTWSTVTRLPLLSLQSAGRPALRVAGCRCRTLSSRRSLAVIPVAAFARLYSVNCTVGMRLSQSRSWIREVSLFENKCCLHILCTVL